MSADENNKAPGAPPAGAGGGAGGPRQRVIGDYTLMGDEPIGTGAQGVVWLSTRTGPDAAHVKQGDVVALKILKPSSIEVGKLKTRIERLLVLRHPHIVEYKEVFIHPDGQRLCIAMEYVDGEALDKLMERHRDGGLPWDQARTIVQQCLDAFSFASAKNVVHRDIKPANVRINTRGEVKIIDFEIARRAEGASSVATVAGSFAGTFAYMAPEFATEGFKGDETSDVFSAGVCFVEVATGVLPFDRFESDRTGIEFMKRWVIQEKWPQPRVDSGVLPDEIKKFLLKMVNPDRGQRHARFAEAMSEFRKFLPREIGEEGGERYEFDEVADLLGKGGFGAVYRARRKSDGRVVAIKQLHAQKYLKRFARERKILQRINHPNIVKFLDFVELESLGQHEYFIIMEFLDGMPDYSLRRRIRHAGGPLPVAESVALFQAYLSAVEHLHENGVIHRDLTPNNLYAPPDRPHEAKVIDLGVAMDESGTMTVGGGLPGVPDYMAPEFATRNNVRGSQQTDLFSVGICFYEALVGRRPFPTLPTDPKRQWAEWIRRCQKLPPVDFSGDSFRQHPALRRIVARVLAPEPEDRYASASEMARDLENVLAPSEEDDVATQMFEGPLPTAEEAMAGSEGKTVFSPLDAVKTQFAPAVPSREEAMGRAPAAAPEKPAKAPPARPAAPAQPAAPPKPAPPPKPPAPLVTLSADQRSIPKGGSTTIRWKVERADSAELDGKAVALSGELQVAPSGRTRYQLVAKGPGGTVTGTVSVGIAINWRPILIGVGAAAAAAIVAMAGLSWWTNRQLGYGDWSASVESVNGLVKMLDANRPKQTVALRAEAGRRFGDAYGAAVDQALTSGNRSDAVALLQSWSEAGRVLKDHDLAVDEAVASALQKKLAEAYKTAFAGVATAAQAAAAQAVMAEWNAVTGRLAAVASFDPAIAANMQGQMVKFRATQEASDLLRDIGAASSFDTIRTALARYKLYREKSGARPEIETRAMTTITGVLATATANFTARPSGLDEFTKVVDGFVTDGVLPAAAKTLLADAGARIDNNLKDRERLQRFQILRDALAGAETAAQLDPLRQQIVAGSWSTDQSASLVELLGARSAKVIGALVPGEAETDSGTLAGAQTALRGLPEWMKKFPQFAQADTALTARIDSAKMAAQKQARIAELRAAIPPAPATAGPQAYAAFAKSVDAVMTDARKELLYPSIAAQVSAVTNATEVAFWKELDTAVAAWSSPERPVALSNWVATARAAAATELPAWARESLTRSADRAATEMRRTEIQVANTSKFPVDVRWPPEMARGADRVAAGIRTNFFVLADYPINVQVAAASSVQYAARRKTFEQTVPPGRSSNLSVADGQFPVLPTTVTWSGAPKELAGLTLQVGGADFAPGAAKAIAPDVNLELTWKRPDHRDVTAACTIPAADRADLAKFVPAADQWVPSEDFTLVKKFIELVGKPDLEAALELKARAEKAVVHDQGLRDGRTAAMQKIGQVLAGRAEAALHAADRVRAACYLYTANGFTREARLAATQKRLAALSKQVVPLMRGAADPRQQMWLALAEKGAQLSAADVQNALKNVPASSEQDADRIVLTYLLDGAAAAFALPQNHPEYQRYWFHSSRLAEFLAEDVEATRAVETADLALAFLASPPKSVVIEADDIAAVKAFLTTARPVVDQQASWTDAQDRLKKLQAAVDAQAARIN